MRRIVVLFAFMSLSIPLAAENWPQWRGPGGQGISRETKLPAMWTPDKNIAWKVEVPGRGHSAPVVWNDRVFITTAIEGEPVPGAKPIEHMDSGKPSVVRRSYGQAPLGANRMGRGSLRQSPSQEQLRLAVGGHRWRARVRILRSRGRLRL
jgi:hypothetical protein